MSDARSEPVFQVGSATSVGRVREHNEDAYLVMEDPERLVLVADGMGGHKAGEVAASIAVDCVRELTTSREVGRRRRHRNMSPQNRLVKILQEANRRILANSQDPDRRGMGTTAVVLWLQADGLAVFGHVGDSRVYRLRGEELDQLSEDHSLVTEYVRLGLIRREEAQNFPYKNVIIRALGLSPMVTVDTGSIQVEPGDRFLLCSDGLTDMVDDAKIRKHLAEATDPVLSARTLVALALAEGGLDNVTAVVVHT